MDSNNMRFGAGPRELGGAVDLVSHFGLWPYHDFFCKNSLPVSISDTHYLRKVVGDTEIRKDNDKKVNQLVERMIRKRKKTPKLHPLGLAILGESFHVQRRDTAPVKPPLAEKEIISSVVNFKSEPKEDKQQRKRRERAEEKHKDPKKHKSSSVDKDSKVKMGSHRKLTSSHLKGS